jgi:hypothetical protein
VLRVAKTNGHALILLGCRLKLPPELEHEITHVDFSLPDVSQLGTVLDGIVKSAKLKNMHEFVRESAFQSALGLTTTEAENAFALRGQRVMTSHQPYFPHRSGRSSALSRAFTGKQFDLAGMKASFRKSQACPCHNKLINPRFPPEDLATA